MATSPNRNANSSDPPAPVASPRPVDMPTLPPLDSDTSSQAPTLPLALELGAAIQVPGYEVQGELGRGGMGVVYLAKNQLMKRPVVLKIVNKALLNANPGMLDRFVREIEVAARLDHENVVKAYHAFWAGELLIFEMEYVEGEDLAKLVKRQGPLPVAHACHYVSQAAMGLQAAHLLHMVHRDIKPHNLILTRRGKRYVVKILDFGLAKAVRAEETAADLTGLGMLGTPAFMAPEQAVDAAHADIRADIYGLGCTLYFLLTGAPPFSGNSHFAVLKAHESADVSSLSQLRAGTPTELATVAAKMLAKDPAKRYQQPIDVAKALAPIIKAALQPPKKKPPVPTAGAGPAPAPQAAGQLTVTPSFGDKPAVVPVRRDAFVLDQRRESQTGTAVRPSHQTAGLARRRFSPARLMGVGGVLGIVFLAAAGAAVLHFLPGPTPSTQSAPSPKENAVPIAEPARAVAPFDAAHAMQFQKAWADYLHVPVVHNVNLDARTTMKLTLIPPGAFRMGSPENETGVRSKEEGPQHQVEITQSFYVGVYPVTKGQFAAFIHESSYTPHGPK